jgi:hypothetical protein
VYRCESDAVALSWVRYLCDVCDLTQDGSADPGAATQVPSALQNGAGPLPGAGHCCCCCTADGRRRGSGARGQTLEANCSACEPRYAKQPGALNFRLGRSASSAAARGRYTLSANLPPLPSTGLPTASKSGIIHSEFKDL